MDIIWHGERCFTIKSKNTTLVIDPYEGGKHSLKKVNADTVLLTNDYDGKAKLVEGADEAEVLNWPGEYEIKGAAVVAIPAYTKEKEEGDTAKGRIIIYSFMVDDVRICDLGPLGDTLDEEMLSKIGDVDILLIPVAGKNALDVKKAHQIVEELDPRIVIPMNYKDEEVQPMLKEMGITEPQELEKLEIKSKSQLPEDRTDFVLLNVSP